MNGGWSSWDAWSSCDKAGRKTRNRKCNSPSPLNDGLSCDGDSEGEDKCPGKLDQVNMALQVFPFKPFHPQSMEVGAAGMHGPPVTRLVERQEIGNVILHLHQMMDFLVMGIVKEKTNVRVSYTK